MLNAMKIEECGWMNRQFMCEGRLGCRKVSLVEEEEFTAITGREKIHDSQWRKCINDISCFVKQSPKTSTPFGGHS